MFISVYTSPPPALILKKTGNVEHVSRNTGVHSDLRKAEPFSIYCTQRVTFIVAVHNCIYRLLKNVFTIVRVCCSITLKSVYADYSFLLNLSVTHNLKSPPVEIFCNFSPTNNISHTVTGILIISINAIFHIPRPRQ